jgi:hypothetical protein
MRSFLIILGLNIFAYTLLYVVYSFAAKSMSGRVAYVMGSVIGTLIGSTIGEKWFR